MHIFSGIFRSRKIVAPKGSETRPTSGRLREALFNICQGEIEGACFLDLFAGSGAMGLEALSRGAVKATFVDNSKESIRCIRTNIEALDLEKSCNVIYGDVFNSIKDLAKAGQTFDLIYADPPYETYASDKDGKKSYSARVVEILEGLIAEGKPLLKPGGSLFIEDAAGILLEGEKASGHLVLHDTRKMGRSALQHWTYKP